MSDSIRLLSPEDARKPYWDQYHKLTDARNKTMDVLRALGVTEFPGDSLPQDTPPQEPPAAQVLTAFASSSRPRSSVPYGEEPLPVLIREAAKSLRSNLTRTTILGHLQQKFPDRQFNPPSVAVIIGNVAREDEWRLIEKGVGGKPSIYAL